MSFLWREKAEKLILPYIQQIKKESKKLTKQQQNFFQLLLKNFESSDNALYVWTKELIAEGEITVIADLYRKERYPVIVLLLGEQWAKRFVAYMEKLPTFPYTSGYTRRTYRSNNPLLHLSSSFSILQDWFFLIASGTDLWAFAYGRSLNEGEGELRQSLSRWEGMISLLLDENNEKAIAYVRDAILGDNQQASVSYHLVRAVLRSNNWEAKKLLGDLLLAARLQEGLRQAVVENIDESNQETFRYFFQLIIDHDLVRFSSVKRAIGTWTGLFNETNVDRMTKKVIDNIQQALLAEDYVQRGLASKDNTEIYLALWRLAFNRVEDAIQATEKLIEEGIEHKVQLVSYFLYSIEDNAMRNGLAKTVLTRYPNNLKMAACYMPHYLPHMALYRVNSKKREALKNEGETHVYYYHSTNVDHRLQDYFADIDEAAIHFELMKNLLAQMDKKEYVIDPCIFPWYGVRLEKSVLAEKLAVTASFLDNDALDAACAYLPQIDTYRRDDFIYGLLYAPHTEIQMSTLVQALADRTARTQTAAYKTLKKLTIESRYYEQIEEMLKYKSGDLRQNVIAMLLSQPSEGLLASLERLLSAKTTEKRLGALDMLLTLKKNNTSLYHQAFPLIKLVTKPTAKEKVLLDQLNTEDNQVETQNATLAAGFGLYTPKQTTTATEVWDKCVASVSETASEQSSSLLGTIKKAVNKVLPINRKETLSVFTLSAEEIFGYYLKLQQLVAKHANDSYRDAYGTEQLLGNVYCRCVPYSEMIADDLSGFPFAALWQQFYQEEINDSQVLLAISLCRLLTAKNEQHTHLTQWLSFDWTKWEEKLQQLPYQNTVCAIMQNLINHYLDQQIINDLALDLLPELLERAKEDNIYQIVTTAQMYNGRTYELYHIFSSCGLVARLLSSLSWHDETSFKNYFAVKYAYFHEDLNYINKNQRNIYENMCCNYFSIFEVTYAVWLKLLPVEALYDTLLVSTPTQLRTATALFKEDHSLNGNDQKVVPYSANRRHSAHAGKTKSAYPQEVTDLLKETTHRIVARLLDIELKRGDTPTEATDLVRSITAIYGVEYFVRILNALGDDTLERSYWSNGKTKREVLSHLLRHCYPKSSDTPEVFRAALAQTTISDKRLVEAAMYSISWLDLVENYLGWQGLASTCYYFLAHMNEYSDDKRKALFAKYTPIDAEDLQLGAFDINWFKEAYQTIGEKRFDIVYEAAKYITDGTKHSRARKFADAVNGKLDVKTTKAQIIDKRNKDLLMAYSLIPLDKKNKNDLLERYQYLQQFLKESKQFGAQRRASESKAVEIAMENLARNAGYDDVTRLTWQMETTLVKEWAPYFKPKTVGDCQISIEIAPDGQADIVIIKNHKSLKSIPTKIKKEPYIDEIKAVHKQLKNQYSRSRIMLEEAMADGTFFYAQELNTLLANPVLAPLISHLVFIHEDSHGYFTKNLLTNAKGETVKLSAKAKLRIAHPFDLYTMNVWADYQQDVFDRQIKQPFKQVFRELYTKTKEELGTAKTMRYAGNQVQPSKTVALLRSRRWVADYENGLQKVYYKENIIAQIYALADWFSPADAEAPTLEWITFTHRKTFKPLNIDDIPDILFSEIMRDVDLVVSVAHVGGVDPETSHSTIEMRKAIVQFTLPLFKLTNVQFADHFAVIEGTLAKYNVHLGSGVVHQQAGSAINILPVHSQQRGRLFLPFVDEDPKTAEILSKILLLAEDNKIKDPFILEQIKTVPKL